ncbi:Clavaminate synthase-like protein [Wilcoxina mikolae CBS 423.85]|nr:Clavaminate synthase-like protein [Wilcoxina mikolae CBS 423.85]
MDHSDTPNLVMRRLEQTRINTIATPMTTACNVISRPPVGGGIPTISYTSTPHPTALHLLTTAAKTHGLAAITSLPTPPFTSIQHLFDTLLTNPALAASLNATYPTRGIFKHAALTNPTCDQKLTIDLSRARVSHIPSSLRTDLGSEFTEVLSFFEDIHNNLVPLLLSATSAIIGSDVGTLHTAENVNYRLCDYRPSSSCDVTAPRCGEHRDYGTVTIIFQNGEGGLEYFSPSGEWVALPGDAVMVLWGLCGQILSGDKIKAVRHRVLKTGKRRNTAMMFVAPDLDAALKPMCSGWEDMGKRYRKEVEEGGMSVGEFKEFIGKKWRHREGNEDIEEDVGSQDDVIEKFLRG